MLTMRESARTLRIGPRLSRIGVASHRQREEKCQDESQTEEETGRRKVETETENRRPNQRPRSIKKDVGGIGTRQPAGIRIAAGEACKGHRAKAPDNPAPHEQQRDIG